MSVMSCLCIDQERWYLYELGKEIEKGIFCLFTSMGQRKKTLLILTVCRTYELHNGSSSPYGLCSSAVEHQSAESGGLRFNSSWGLRIFSFSHTRDKTENMFLYFFTELKTYHFS